MKHLELTDLPPPPPGKTDWPWTEETRRISNAPVKGSPWPKISVVTPSFNQGGFLEETIRSVLLQGYPELEYIVVDGGSSDNSVEILRKYEPWLAHWTSEPDLGQANAINKGFQKSSGHIMGWLNSDDCINPSALQRIAKQFMADNSIDIVCGFREVVSYDNKRLYIEAHLRPDRYTLSRRCYVNQETIYWRRAVWENIGGLDETFQYALDYELWQRMLKAGYTFDLMPCFIGTFRAHPEAKKEHMDAVRNEDLKKIYGSYLNTAKTEEELEAEISHSWHRRMRILNWLGTRGLLKSPFIAQIFVSLLSADEKKYQGG